MSQTNAEPIEVVSGTVPGPLTIRFPVSMFLPEGKTEYRIHRSRYLKQAAEWYDSIAEQCRVMLNEEDGVERPPLEKLGLAIIDVDAIAKAVQQEIEQ